MSETSATTKESRNPYRKRYRPHSGKRRDAGKEAWGFVTDCFGNIRWVEGDDVPEHRDALREAFLAGLRVGVARLKLATLDLEAVGVSVKRGLLPVEQAIADLHARDLLDWLFPDSVPDRTDGEDSA